MLSFFGHRFLYMIVTLFLVSIVSFLIIQLPPGDFLSSYIANLEAIGTDVSEADALRLREQYGLNRPVVVQYVFWMENIFHGNLGYSFDYRKPVVDLLSERLGLTVSFSLVTVILTYLIAIPIGIYSATHQYTPGDYAFSFLGFIGLAIPEFLIALILMWYLYVNFNVSIGGLFSPEFESAAWSMAKFVDLLKHLPVPIIVVSIGGTASLIRIMRGTLLDELRKPYVIAARTRGLSESKLLLKYPVRMAILPLVSTIGWLLPALVSGSTIISIVLNLPTIGALLFRALISQDMYLAGGSVLFLTAMTIVGMLISDLLLVWLDPRIRIEH